MINMQLVLIIFNIGLLLYLYNRYKKGVGQQMIIAFLISIAWVAYSQIYIYKDTNYILFGLNIFPLIAWTAGLTFLRERYENMTGKNKFWKATIFFVVSLTVLEYLGYNYWGIQLASNFPGLFGLPLLHAPLLGKIFYLTVGPIYLKITDYLGVK